jgi:hypothetical protein
MGMFGKNPIPGITEYHQILFWEELPFGPLAT